MLLDWLETFLAVVERGGFTAASESVHRSQSRVSAHIAGLERELGVRLIDRTHRPATVTPAGRVLAEHAREIVAGVSSARSAVAAVRALHAESLSVLTAPCIGASVLPEVIATVLAAYPRTQLTITEGGPGEVGTTPLAEGTVVAVLPALPQPLAPGLRERLLYREPLRLLVPPDHELARQAGPVELAALPRRELIMCSSAGEPEVRRALAERGHPMLPKVLVDTPGTLVALVRSGVGVGLISAVALRQADVTGLIERELADPDLVRDVAVYWYEVVSDSPVGALLLEALEKAPLPEGAEPPAYGSPGVAGVDALRSGHSVEPDR